MMTREGKTMTIKEMREELVQICSRTRVDCEECLIFDCCHLTSVFHTPKCMTNAEIKRVYAAYQEHTSSAK